MRGRAKLGVFACAILSAFACDNGTVGGNGTDAGTDVVTETGSVGFSYAPAGCNYSVVPTSLGLNNTSFNDSNGVSTLALDDTAAPSGDITPSLVRVGLGGGTDSSMPGYADPTTTAAFMWETPTQTNAAKVKLGTSMSSLSMTHTGYSWVTPKDLGSKPTYAHAVHVCGLQPGTTYYYQVGGGPTGMETWSAVQSFSTPPQSKTMTIGLLGDARDQVSTWQLANERMRTLGVAMMVMPGDIVDIGAEGDLWTQWLTAVWKDPMNPASFLTLGQIPMAPIAGNHEGESSQFYGNWVLPGGGMYAGTYYSFNVGNTHFVLMDDEFAYNQTDFTQPPASVQLGWLDADLNRANMNRANVPFIVVLNHRGLYSTSLHSRDADVLAARGAMAPIFDKYNVDLVFNGHDHEYERSNPLKAGTPPSGDPVVGSGTTYIICAGAGAEPYGVGTVTKSYSNKQVGFGFNSPPGTNYLGVYGTLTMNGNVLTWQAYGLNMSAPDTPIDTFMISH